MRNTTRQENPTAKAVILAEIKKFLSPKKETSFVDFIKENNLKSLRSKKLRFATRVSVVKNGREIYGYGNTFHEAFSELKRKFGTV
jgi:hypothetical protein